MIDPITTRPIGYIRAGLPVRGGNPVKCEILLNQPARAAGTVTLHSSHKEVAILPSGGKIPISKGERRISFDLGTDVVSHNIRVLISGETRDGILVGAHQDIKSQ